MQGPAAAPDQQPWAEQRGTASEAVSGTLRHSPGRREPTAGLQATRKQVWDGIARLINLALARARADATDAKEGGHVRGVREGRGDAAGRPTGSF